MKKFMFSLVAVACLAVASLAQSNDASPEQEVKISPQPVLSTTGHEISSETVELYDSDILAGEKNVGGGTAFPLASATWTGAVSNAWNVAGNWSPSGIPYSSTDVTIPGGTPNQPVIGMLVNANCQNLVIQSGAVLTINYLGTLYMHGNLDSDAGLLIMASDGALLDFGGSTNTHWDDDNENDTYTHVRVNKDTPTSELAMWQDMTCSGIFEIMEGIFSINAAWTLTITNTDAAAFNVQSGGSLLLNGQTIHCAGGVYFENGSQATINGGKIYCGMNYTVDPNNSYNIVFTGGTLVMDGNGTQYINDLDGGASDLFNLDIDKIGGVCYIKSYDLTINGSLTINAGTFSCNNGPSPTTSYNIYVYGNWTNNVGTSGFDESDGLVGWNGDAESDITTSETFYDLQVNKTYTGYTGLEFASGTTIDVLHYLTIYDGTIEMSTGCVLNVANQLGISSGAGLNANDGGIAINLQGSWSNHNTSYTITQGFDPGDATVTFNGSVIQNLQTDATFETFYTVIINKSGGFFRPYDGMRILGDLDIQCGTWDDMYAGTTHEIFGDLAIHSGGSYISDGTTCFRGTSDQHYMKWAGGNSTFQDLTVDKTALDEGMDFLPGEEEDPVTEADPGDPKSMTLILDASIILEGDLIIAEGTLDLNHKYLKAGGLTNIENGGTLQVDDGATLYVGTGLQVSGSGTLQTYGTAGSNAMVRKNGNGYYSLAVAPDGTISSEYTIFKNMNSMGIYCPNQSLVDPAHPFNYCTFQDASAGSTLLYFENSQDITITGANFPANTWGGLYNVTKENLNGHVTFINATGLFAGAAYENDPWNKIDWTFTGILVDVKVNCQGPYNSGTGMMNTNINGVLPLSHPFHPAVPYFGNPMPDWYYAGAESVLSIPNGNIVDWVLLELRDAPSAAAATPATAVARQACFLLRNGKVVDLDGVSPVDFLVNITQGLYVVLWQRNHLGVMSSVALTKVGSTYSYDFSTAAGQAYLSGQKLLATGVYGMYSGDGNGDGQVANADKLEVWAIQSGNGGYKEGDFNLSGQVDNQDKVEFWKPNSGAGSQIP
jgi:hypothetical protein